MKFGTWILIGIGALFAWMFISRKGLFAVPTGSTVQTTGTARNAPLPWLPSWTGFNQQSLASTTSTVKDAFSSLRDISNAFGFNDGGKSPNVSTGGSSSGGTQSSGSGAGVPDSSTSFDVWGDWDTAASRLYITDADGFGGNA